MSEVNYPNPNFSQSPQIKQTKAIITDIFQIDSKTLEQIAFWLEGRGLRIPLSQITGYSTLTQASRIQTTAGKTIPNGSSTITFDQMVFDSGGMWDAAAPTKLTVQTPGKFIVGTFGNVGATSGPGIAVLKNGSTTVCQMGGQNGTSGAPSVLAVAMIDMVNGDYFTSVATQWTGANSTLAAGASMWAALATL